MNDENSIAVTMTAILGTMVAIIASLIYIQTPSSSDMVKSSEMSTFLPNSKTQPSKYAYEMYGCCYTPVWITVFGIIVLFRLYEDFTAFTYEVVVISLALPFLLQPILLPSAGFQSPDSKRPLYQRYAFKANVWLAIYSFIGNYWYTHYFYSVLKASYTMPSHWLNNVPITTYVATHFYFSSYHLFSNACLRKVNTSYQKGIRQKTLYIGTVVTLSYFTAFMETLTISSFPYYSFEDRYLAYTIGSAFYGIYFLVSFPAFVAFDDDIDSTAATRKVVSIWDTIVSSCGYCMIILCLLDFVRLQVDVPLIVGKLKK